MTRFFAALFLAASTTLAQADVTWEQIREIYSARDINIVSRDIPMDAAWLNQVRGPLATIEGGPDAILALEIRFEGSVLHLVSYGTSSYEANIIEHNGRVILAFFYLPLFDLQGRSPPAGFVEVVGDISAAMTDNSLSAQAIIAAITASPDEARAYADGVSTQTYPGALFGEGINFNYSVVALVPDHILVTVTTLPDCPFRSNTPGWLTQHICSGS